MKNKQFNKINKLDFNLIVNEIESKALKDLLIYFKYKNVEIFINQIIWKKFLY